MRNNHVAMAVINKRLAADSSANEARVAKLAEVKCVLEYSLEQLKKTSVTLEEKTVMLAEKVDDLQLQVKNLEQELKDAHDLNSIKVEAEDLDVTTVDLADYALAKDARIRVIKGAVDTIKYQLGSWGKFNLEDKDVDALLKDIYELL